MCSALSNHARQRGAAGARRGFTLVEVMAAVALAGIVMAGVLATNLHLIGSGVRITHYAEMQTQVRRGFDQLGRDLRRATAVTWNGASDITLTVPVSATTSTRVTYAWTPAARGFFVVPGADSTVTAGRLHLIRDLSPLADGTAPLTFVRFDRDGNIASTDAATKRIQVVATITRGTRTAPAVSSNLASASYTLRNKFAE